MLDVCCLGFAAWTVLCNAVVLAEGSLLDLLWLSGGAIVVAGVVLALRWKRTDGAPADRATPVRSDAAENQAAQSDPAGGHLLGGTHRAAALVAGLLVLLSYPATGNFDLFWWLFTAYFAVAALIATRRPLEHGAMARGTRAQRKGLALLGIGVLCAAITLLAHRPTTTRSSTSTSR